MAWPMPARRINRPMTWPEMKNDAIVVRAQAASETMRARRSASRCSMTDIRCSSTGWAFRGARCKTLFRRATKKASGDYEEVVLLLSEDVVEAVGGAGSGLASTDALTSLVIS